MNFIWDSFSKQYTVIFEELSKYKKRIKDKQSAVFLIQLNVKQAFECSLSSAQSQHFISSYCFRVIYRNSFPVTNGNCRGSTGDCLVVEFLIFPFNASLNQRKYPRRDYYGILYGGDGERSAFAKITPSSMALECLYLITVIEWKSRGDVRIPYISRLEYRSGLYLGKLGADSIPRQTSSASSTIRDGSTNRICNVNGNTPAPNSSASCAVHHLRAERIYHICDVFGRIYIVLLVSRVEKNK